MRQLGRALVRWKDQIAAWHEAHDEWAVAERRYLSEESMAKLHAQPPATVTDDAAKEAPLAVTA